MAQFAASVGKWVHDVNGAMEAIFRGSVSDLVEELNEQITTMVYAGPPAKSGYRRTGFLRASLTASNTAMPLLTRDNPGGSYGAPDATIVAVIEGTELGGTIYLGYTANYAGHVHYGANGQQARPWVTLVAQRWSAIVEAKAAELKARLGL